ncbi:hypothetical protein [Ornithinimicrobium kibberense]|uniref:hypothetical protein n=1 Tax=Ornithinimicrobium kibberense TaxID=282060 RepID=UPI00360BA441
MDAPDHAPLAQGAHPHQAGGLGDADLAGEHRVGHPPVLLQQAHQRQVGLVQGLDAVGRVLRHTVSVCGRGRHGIPAPTPPILRQY